MAMEVGYNISKANELEENIAAAFGKFEGYTQEEWDPVKNKLRDEWVGEDEQNFEQKFIERLCALYENAHALAQTAVNNIEGLKLSWVEFQKKNNLDADGAGQGQTAESVEGYSIPKTDSFITFSGITFSDDQDKGLASASSASNIKATIGDFVGNIKSRTQELFDSIDVNSAFFGSQTTAIKGYIVKCGNSIAEITSAIKDLHDTLDQLAKANYESSADVVTETFNTNSENVESKVDELIGESRWS